MAMDTTPLMETPIEPHAANALRPLSVDGADVLVVIPVLNEAAHIEACVRSLMTGDQRLREAGFVVAEVNSLDKVQGSYRQVTSATAVKQDLVISVAATDRSGRACVLKVAMPLDMNDRDSFRH